MTAIFLVIELRLSRWQAWQLVQLYSLEINWNYRGNKKTTDPDHTVRWPVSDTQSCFIFVFRSVFSVSTVLSTLQILIQSIQ